MSRPSPNGGNGRGPGGRFAKGWKGGPGNPHAKRAADLRSALLAAVTPKDVRAAVSKLVELATAGDLAAIRELLDRVCGKAGESLAVNIENADAADVATVNALRLAMLEEDDYLE